MTQPNKNICVAWSNDDRVCYKISWGEVSAFWPNTKQEEAERLVSPDTNNACCYICISLYLKFKHIFWLNTFQIQLWCCFCLSARPESITIILSVLMEHLPEITRQSKHWLAVTTRPFSTPRFLPSCINLMSVQVNSYNQVCCIHFFAIDLLCQ